MNGENEKEQESIQLNNQTVGNLKRYLESFPDDAKVVIYTMDENMNYKHYDCLIACNFNQQHENNMVQLLIGNRLAI